VTQSQVGLSAAAHIHNKTITVKQCLKWSARGKGGSAGNRQLNEGVVCCNGCSRPFPVGLTTTVRCCATLKKILEVFP